MHGARWDRTPLRGQLLEGVDAVVTQFDWILQRHD